MDTAVSEFRDKDRKVYNYTIEVLTRCDRYVIKKPAQPQPIDNQHKLHGVSSKYS